MPCHNALKIMELRYFVVNYFLIHSLHVAFQHPAANFFNDTSKTCGEKKKLSYQLELGEQINFLNYECH